jgi:cytochrome P450
MSARPVAAIDLTDPAVAADPYPAFARLREAGPALWHEPSRRWLVPRHGSAGAALRNRHLGRIWSDRDPAARFEPFNLLHRNQMMENEPPEHTRLRRLVAQAFGRGHVERLRPRVRELAEGLLDAVDPRDFDVIGEYAEPLPVLVIAELLGVPVEDHTRLRSWSQAIVRMYEEVRPPDVEDRAIAAAAAFADYIHDHAERKRRTSSDDLLSDLVRAHDEGDRLSDDEVVASAVLLLNAGHEASVNVFGNGLVTLLEHPDQLRRVAEDPGLALTAVEEMLRFDSALQLFERTATAPVTVGGQRVVEGEKVAVLLGSANRDRSVFERADEFDVARDPNPHLAFGAGLHFCLGSPLARVELVESLQALMRRSGDWRLVRTSLRRPTLVLRGYESLWIGTSTASTSTHPAAEHAEVADPTHGDD